MSAKEIFSLAAVILTLLAYFPYLRSIRKGTTRPHVFYIAILAYRKKADIRILLIDYVFFGIALLAIPLWIFTANPMWAVILITLIDVCGFIPTIRKAYYFPEQESMNFYFVFFIRCIFVILALEAYSLTTILFPLTIGLSSLLMCFILLQRNSIHSTTPI